MTRYFGAGVWAVGLLSAAGAVGAAAQSAASLHGTARVASRPAANVVVWLEVPDARRPPPKSGVVLDQRNLTFSPQVMVVQVGTAVLFPNNDRVFHNVFSFKDGKQFDLGLYPAGVARTVTFDRPGLSRIFCNIHPGMAAYVMAVETPYFAVSNSSGEFAMAAIEPGTYTYHAWRPGGGQLTGEWSSVSHAPLDVQWP